MHHYDVVALGELLIDFTPAGISDNGNPIFEMNPGGAPANVLVAVARLGGKCAFIGKVGNDHFGHFLKRTLDNNNVDTQGLKYAEQINTTLAFVHLDERGERSFTFLRNPGADTLLEEHEIETEMIDRAQIFHFGSLSMTHQPAEKATLKAVEYAKNGGKVISYDPNWRPSLWKDVDTAKQKMILGLRYADIAKLSEEELKLLTGEPDIERAAKMVLGMGVKLVLVTLGEQGCYYMHSRGQGRVPAYQVKVVDTTGAGDAFLGGVLYNISRINCPIEKMECNQLDKVIQFANATAALCITKRGGIPAMPSIDEVEELLKESKL